MKPEVLSLLLTFAPFAVFAVVLLIARARSVWMYRRHVRMRKP